MAIPDARLDDLRRRLQQTRWIDEVEDGGWAYGFRCDDLRRLVEYWIDGFDWRRVETLINSFSNWRATVDSVGLHFIHEPGRGPAPLPLLLVHGWPGSFLEMLSLIPRLTDPARFGGSHEDAFTVVVPSLPGYGFSDRPGARGMTSRRIADLFARLMAALGHQRYGTQGGDWGAGISTWLALAEPDRVVGVHLNYVPGSYRPHVEGALTAAELTFLDDKERWHKEEGAYGHLQATRPDTLAHALNDSPAGLLAWVVEKFRDWSDCDGDVERRFTADELLANVTLYWLTGTIASSMRLYLESTKTPLTLLPGQRVRVPTAVACFPKEAPSPPREWVARGYDLTRWTAMPRGGHFAAMEEPELLARDIAEFFRPLRN